jgi:integrase
MAGAKKDPRLQTATARLRLKAADQRHWLNVAEGIALGYRRGPQGGSWYCRIYQGRGKYSQEQLGSADDNVEANGETILTFYQAQEKARKHAAQEHRRQGIGAVRNATVADAADRYLLWYADHRRAIKETGHIVQAHIRPTFGEIKLSALKARDIRAWMEKLATSPARKRTAKGKRQQYRDKPKTEDQKRARRATANRILAVLKAILNRAIQDELTNDDTEWRAVKPFKQADEPVVRFLTEAEATRLINACKPDFRRLVKAALFTGARYGELAALVAADMNPDTGSIYIRPSKSGKGRHIPLNADGLRFFKEIHAGKNGNETLLTKKDGTAWGKNHHVRMLLEACKAKAARIEPAVGFHELRHTYASTLAQRGVDLLTISKLLGHADTRITSRLYAHLADQTLRDAVAKLPGFGHQPETNVASIQ